MSKRRLTPRNGVYVASNIQTIKAWNCKVRSDKTNDSVIGPSGNVSHLREMFTQPAGGIGGEGGCGCVDGGGGCGGGGGLDGDGGGVGSCGCGGGDGGDGGEILKECKMYWLTDRTPHQLIPLKRGSYVQEFRLVTSEVGVWYENEWTKNPLGVQPDNIKTIILRKSQKSQRRVINGTTKKGSGKVFAF